MTYRNLVSCHVSDAMQAELVALAKSREMTVASLLRQLIAQEIRNPPDRAQTAWRYTLFMAVALDGLLGANPDQELRARMHQIWHVTGPPPGGPTGMLV